uniref:Uncharacterized protein n=1 Tax=Oryza glumipatula TaxID=40148 RepID=A0A0E0AVW5_9ORYZ
MLLRLRRRRWRWRWRRRRRQREERRGGRRLGEPAVEVAVAPTRGALERRRISGIRRRRRHELPAPIHRVPAQARRHSLYTAAVADAGVDLLFPAAAAAAAAAPPLGNTTGLYLTPTTASIARARSEKEKERKTTGEEVEARR